MAELATTSLASDANLKAYYRLESNFTDSSSDGYNLTAIGTPTDVAGKFGNAKSFTAASSQGAYIPNASCAGLQITGAITISCWFNPTTIATKYLIAKTDAANGYDLEMQATGKVNFICRGLSTTPNLGSDLTISTGTWNHLVGIYDSANSLIKIWINGTKKQATATGTMINAVVDFSIAEGQSVNGASGAAFVDGILDDVAVFNRALTDAEVLTLYNPPTGGSFLVNFL